MNNTKILERMNQRLSRVAGPESSRAKHMRMTQAWENMMQEPGCEHADAALRTWAVWCKPGRGGEVSPMFRVMHKTGSAGGPSVHGAESVGSVVEQLVKGMAPDLAKTLRLWYVQNLGPSQLCQRLGLDMTQAHARLRAGRLAVQAEFEAGGALARVGQSKGGQSIWPAWLLQGRP